MSAFPTPPPAAAVMPLSVPPQVRRDWSGFGLPDHGWVQVYDKESCRVCSTGKMTPCVSSCISHHGLRPEARLSLQTCAQCDPAPCEESCPTGAIFHNAQGAVEIDQELCIGCQFCEDVCPNDALMFIDPYETSTPAFGLPGYSPGQPAGALPNTVAKCTLCSDRLTEGQLPYCADACPSGAIWVGNLDRDTVTNGLEVMRLSEMLKQRRYEVLKPGQRVIHLY